MSTPSGRPTRPASVFDYAPKRVREQWDRSEADDSADAEFADDRTGDDDEPGEAEAGGEAERTSSLVPKGAHEGSDDDAGDDEDRLTQAWEHEDAEREPDDAGDRRTEDWLDELAYRAELRDRRAKAAEMDREYEDQLERLAASLRTLRDEDETEPERLRVGEPRHARSLHAPDVAERDLYIDGVRLPRFLQSSYAPPQPREGGTGWLGFVLASVIACAVGAPLSYYFYTIGNPLASKPGESATKSEVQYTIASVADRLPKLVGDASPAKAAAPAIPAAPALQAAHEAAPAVQAAPPIQAAPKPAPATRPPAAAPAELSQSQQAPRRVPLKHVVRWPDQAQDSAAPAQRATSAAPSAPAPALETATQTLAFAPAFTPVPSPPAPKRPPVGDADEVQLLLKQGQEFAAAGDFATARVVLRRAAEAGAAEAALALAQTYDPKVLAKMRSRGVTPDAAEARRWYETAQRLGSSEAVQQLDRLARHD